MSSSTPIETDRGTWTPPDDEALTRVMRDATTIAVVGASGDPSRPSHGVTAYLINAGYTVWPVHPKETEILGVPVFASLADLPGTPDIVDVFRKADALPGVAEQAIGTGASVFWAQLGLHSDDAVRIAHGAGLEVVTDRCIKVEHARLLG